MSSKSWEGTNYYRDLGVSSDATFEEIRTAYRNSAKDFHPDLNNDPSRRELFDRATQAYSVLRDPEERKKYDEFLAINPTRRVTSKRRGSTFSGFSARLALLVVALLLLKNFGLFSSSFLPNQGNGSGANNLQSSSGNQVLALMVGPDGPPGPAGVAGANGFIGLNGYNGADGIAGAPGPVGEQGPIGPEGKQGLQGIQGLQGLQGAGVAIVRLSSDSNAANYDASCPTGGTKLIASDGTISYACNGSGSGGSGGGSQLGLGYTQIGSCDSSVKISLESAYRNVYVSGVATQDFTMDAIVFDKVAGVCNGFTLTAILKLKSSIAGGANASNVTTYYNGDAIECTISLSLDPLSGIDANSISITYPDCVNKTHPSTAFRFYDILARDVSEAADGLAIQIA